MTKWICPYRRDDGFVLWNHAYFHAVGLFACAWVCWCLSAHTISELWSVAYIFFLLAGTKANGKTIEQTIRNDKLHINTDTSTFHEKPQQLHLFGPRIHLAGEQRQTQRKKKRERENRRMGHLTKILVTASVLWRDCHSKSPTNGPYLLQTNCLQVARARIVLSDSNATRAFVWLSLLLMRSSHKNRPARTTKWKHHKLCITFLRLDLRARSSPFRIRDRRIVRTISTVFNYSGVYFSLVVFHFGYVRALGSNSDRWRAQTPVSLCGWRRSSRNEANCYSLGINLMSFSCAKWCSREHVLAAYAVVRRPIIIIVRHRQLAGVDCMKGTFVMYFINAQNTFATYLCSWLTPRNCKMFRGVSMIRLN